MKYSDVYEGTVAVKLGRNKKAVTCNARFSQLSSERREENGPLEITLREKLSRGRLSLRDRVATSEGRIDTRSDRGPSGPRCVARLRRRGPCRQTPATQPQAYIRNANACAFQTYSQHIIHFCITNAHLVRLYLYVM